MLKLPSRPRATPIATRTTRPAPRLATRGAVRLGTAQLAALLVVLVPLAYLGGRFATSWLAGTPWVTAAAALSTIALGGLIGIPIGLFFAGIRTPAAPPAEHHPDTIRQQDKILAQLREELMQNQKLFESRQGNDQVLTRISYLTSFWSAVKASGQLFVMQDPALLRTIALAYYWIDQANRLEGMAYEAQYQPSASPDNQNASTHLIAEARLLDGPLGIALQTAIDAIDHQVAADTTPAAPPQ